MNMSRPEKLGAWRTRDLRDLLEDENKMNHIVRRSEKVQRLQRAAEKIRDSNQKMATVSLSLKPKFRDAKLLLSVKYKELDKLRSLIQAKQEQLAEKRSVHYAQWGLLKKVDQAEEECELLFQMFAEGKATLPDFLSSFLSSLKLHHIRLVLVKKLQETLGDEQDALRFPASSPDHIHQLCGLTAAVVFASCCHPRPLLLPLPAHRSLVLRRPPTLGPEEFPGGRRRGGPRWPARPVRLQPLWSCSRGDASNMEADVTQGGKFKRHHE
ncbi:vacuolar protein sorting-associated protein 37D-like [Mugil cephalus]|uniref:vacuolar protein sorting-associated protein 37D-like n=1 Tax=Mugil cephalus TaxID=48193 RepID=UPI001FB82DE1|nr:vacuolar protein sorting-associated protein 37D-like [Mugil cephalus]